MVIERTNTHVPPLPPGEGSGGQDRHQVAEAHPADQASPRTLVTHQLLDIVIKFSSSEKSLMSNLLLQDKLHDFWRPPGADG